MSWKIQLKNEILNNNHNNITPTFSHGWMKMHDYKSFILRVLPNNPVIVTLLWFSPFSYLLVKVPNQKESISQSTNTVLFYFLVWIEEKTISHWSISVRPKRTNSDGLKSESYNFDNKKLPCHLLFYSKMWMHFNDLSFMFFYELVS